MSLPSHGCRSQIFAGVAPDALVSSRDEFLSQEDLDELLENHQVPGASALQAGDADQDLDFDQLDLALVENCDCCQPTLSAVDCKDGVEALHCIRSLYLVARR